MRHIAAKDLLGEIMTVLNGVSKGRGFEIGVLKRKGFV